MTIRNTPASAKAMTEVLDATSKLKGAKARLAVAIAARIKGDPTIRIGTGTEARTVAFASYFDERTRINSKGVAVADNSVKRGIWEAFAETECLLNLEKLSKSQATTALSAFAEMLRPAVYIASRGFDLSVTADGHLKGVPFAEAVTLFTDTGEQTKAFKARITRAIDEAETEGRKLSEAKAAEKVAASKVTTTGKADIPTASEVLARFGRAAVAAGLVAAPKERDVNRRDEKAFDDALASLLSAFTKIAESDEAPFAPTDERDDNIRRVVAAATAYLAAD